MLHRRPRHLLFAAAVLVSAVTACASPFGTDTPDRAELTVEDTGTVRWIDLEGGFFAIEGDDGTMYDPINLAEEYRRDGLRVRFDAQILPDMASVHMFGHIVELRSIEAIGD